MTKNRRTKAAERRQAPKPGVRLLLNDGETEIDNATILVRWFFSKRVIDQNPEWILIFEQDQKESELSDDKKARVGRRYAFRVDQVWASIQIFTSGWHRFGVIVLKKNRCNEEIVEGFLKTHDDVFRSTVSWRCPETEYYGLNVAADVVQFFVPPGVFAKKPEAGLGLIIWKLINGQMHHSDPADECDYRKRRVYAIPFFLLWWPISRFFKYLFGFAYALIVLVMGLWWAFWGWRPKNILAEMWGGFLWRRDEFEMRVHPFDWRAWERDWRDEKKASWPMPYELVIAVVIIWFLIHHWDTVLEVIAGIGFVVLAYYLSRLAAKMKRKKAQLRAQKEEIRRKEWLLANFSTAKMSRSVDLEKLPGPLGNRAQIVHIFRVGFWMAKRRVCRPYSKN